MSKYIKNLIEQGENENLDFKFEISDAKKIARTFSAFANTSGGILLIGVKDNGVIAGIKTDEEIYMAEAAADLYCQPPVKYESHNWNVDGKWVLEIKIKKSSDAPHLAPWKDDKKMAFIRIKDQNHLANAIIFNVLRQQNESNKGILVTYKEEEKKILKFISENEPANFQSLWKATKISKYKLKKILSKLISIKVIAYDFNDSSFVYKLTQEK